MKMLRKSGEYVGVIIFEQVVLCYFVIFNTTDKFVTCIKLD